jgi:hypothetical protein
MKGKNKLGDLSKVYIQLTEDKRDMLISTAKKLLKIQKSNDQNPLPIDEKKKTD